MRAGSKRQPGLNGAGVKGGFLFALLIVFKRVSHAPGMQQE